MWNQSKRGGKAKRGGKSTFTQSQPKSVKEKVEPLPTITPTITPTIPTTVQDESTLSVYDEIDKLSMEVNLSRAKLIQLQKELKDKYKELGRLECEGDFVLTADENRQLLSEIDQLNNSTNQLQREFENKLTRLGYLRCEEEVVKDLIEAKMLESFPLPRWKREHKSIGKMKDVTNKAYYDRYYPDIETFGQKYKQKYREHDIKRTNELIDFFTEVSNAFRTIDKTDIAEDYEDAISKIRNYEEPVINTSRAKKAGITDKYILEDIYDFNTGGEPDPEIVRVLAQAEGIRRSRGV